MLAPVTEADFGEDDLVALNLIGARAWPAFARELEAESGVRDRVPRDRDADRRGRPRRGRGPAPDARAAARAGARGRVGRRPRVPPPGAGSRAACRGWDPRARRPSGVARARWRGRSQRALAGAGGELRRGARRRSGRSRAEGVEAVLLEGGERLAARAVVLADGRAVGRAGAPAGRARAGAAREGTDPAAAGTRGRAAAGRAGDPHAGGLCGPARATAGWSWARPWRSGASTCRSRPAACWSSCGAPTRRCRGVSELELVEAARGPAAGRAGQRADRGRERGGRARLGDRPLAQRDPARTDHRRGGRGAAHRRRAARGVRSVLAAPIRAPRARR